MSKFIETDSSARPRVAAYILLPPDPTKAGALRAKLIEFQRSLGTPIGFYEERPENHRSRPVRRRLVRRARRGDVDLIVVISIRHVAVTRARAAQIVLRTGRPFVTLSGLRLDPSDRLLRWIARERSEQRRRIKRALDQKRERGERIGAIPTGYKLADDGVHFVEDAREQAAMAMARKLAKHGMSARRIATKLTDAGHRSRSGRPFTHRQIGRWLTR